MALRRGIQVLRAIQWDLGHLRRRAYRPGNEPRPVSAMLEDGNGGSMANLAGLCSAPPSTEVPQSSTTDAILWTNQKLGEWLRCIDLAEYAVNLRGSGVHGGLLVLEPRFGCDLLAQLLNIPSCKSLLRRHLYTHFVALVGSAAQAEKRALEAKGQGLTVNAKVKSTASQGGGSSSGHKLHRGLPAIFGGGGSSSHHNNLQPSDSQLLCPRSEDENSMKMAVSASELASMVRKHQVSCVLAHSLCRFFEGEQTYECEERSQ